MAGYLVGFSTRVEKQKKKVNAKKKIHHQNGESD
jgi:hypothetical protein